MLSDLHVDDMLQVVAVSTVQSTRHLLAGGSGSTPVIYLWEKVIPEAPEPARRAAVRPAVAEGVDRPDNAINGPVIFLVLLLTYSNWSPHFYHLVDFIVQTIRDLMGAYGL